jgi:hypothetical protein
MRGLPKTRVARRFFLSRTLPKSDKATSTAATDFFFAFFLHLCKGHASALALICSRARHHMPEVIRPLD